MPHQYLGDKSGNFNTNFKYSRRNSCGKFGTSVVDYKEINSHKNIKLSSLDSLIKTIKLHDKNKVIGFTNGCFDLLHAGHISYLKAKELCDILILALNSDLSIKKLKGKIGLL